MHRHLPRVAVRTTALIGCAIALGALWAPPAAASERRFAYTYESAVLPPGHVELEPWTTLRYGRPGYYHRYDLRLEMEFGIVDRLQTALYWNLSAIGENEAGVRHNELEFEGISSEWKYQLSDPVADGIGSALYLEGTFAPSEAEAELKIILDKRWESFLVAFNLEAEMEWEFEAEETETEQAIEASLGGTYLLNDTFSIGLEVVSHTGIHEGEVETSTLHAGPTFAWATEAWWATLHIGPQVVAFAGSGDDSPLDLEHSERLQARLLLGFHL